MNGYLINTDKKLYYNEKFGFFTRNPKVRTLKDLKAGKSAIQLLSTRQDIELFMTEFNLKDSDVIDLRTR